MSPGGEKLFRAAELTCYGALTAAFLLIRVLANRGWPYFMPLTFVALSATGLVFMARFFIYEYPEHLFDRTIKRSGKFSNRTRLALRCGFAMCALMLTFGAIGLYDPALMNRIVSTLSPMRLFL